MLFCKNEKMRAVSITLRVYSISYLRYSRGILINPLLSGCYLIKRDFRGSVGQSERNYSLSLPASRLDQKIPTLIMGVLKTVSLDALFCFYNNNFIGTRASLL